MNERERSARAAGSGAERGPTLRPDSNAVLLWDLDGTIVDTSRDLATAVSRILQSFGYEPLPLDIVVSHVGKGAFNLVARCLEERGRRVEGTPDQHRALEEFDRHYADCLLDTTLPYPGMEDLLRSLHRAGRFMGIVSNKPHHFCVTILRELGLDTCFHTILGEGIVPQRKPDPEPVFHALDRCGEAGASAESRAHAILIGDSWVDVQTAGAARIRSIGVGWGLGVPAEARAAGPDWWVESVPELVALLSFMEAAAGS